MQRRTFALSALAAFARPQARVTAIDLVPVRATARTVWLLVRIRTDAGVTGWGEASDAFGFTATTKDDQEVLARILRELSPLLAGKSPLNIEPFRQAAWPKATTLVNATAISAIEQALWDISGQLLDLPVHALFGGKTRSKLPVYANINRATKPRTPSGFAAAAKAAVRDGFQSLKLAPWDGFPKRDSPKKAIDAHIEQGIACLAAVREAAGPKIAVMTDCHSFFDIPLAIRVAKRLEPINLAWYEEPVPPERTRETLEIRKGIKQQMAGGEILFGVKGFEPLCREHAVHVIMPDVKHCGGLLEMTHIAAMAEAHGVTVAPHNPSGPIATAASIHVCAGMKNFHILEMQWGEVDWRGRLLKPEEKFVNGEIAVSDAPGFGVTVDESLAAKYLA